MPPHLSFRARYARYILEKDVNGLTSSKGPLQGMLPIGDGGSMPLRGMPLDEIKHNSPFFANKPEPKRNEPICVVGAGAAGLAVAICLSIAGYTNVEILEAHPSRVGGRCYTHSFSTEVPCKHNYYDVGAMRIPEIDTMKSTFTWIDYLNAEVKRLKRPRGIVKSEYILDAPGAPSMYFYTSEAKDPKKFKAFMTDEKKGILTKNGFLDPETLKPTANFDDAFEQYIKSADTPDRYSTRGFLMNKPDPIWSYEDTQIAETFNTSTGLFDLAFMETICDYYDFQIAEKGKWWRVEDGMATLTDVMHDIAVQKGAGLILNAPVFSMKTRNSDEVVVDYAGPHKDSKTYKAVFNTTTLGALQRMDLSGLNLQNDQLLAIRALNYDRATKVAIKFKTSWWSSIMPATSGDPYKFGGVSSSDLTISKVVYPSWDDGSDKPHVIIVSYSWAQDAMRMASLVTKNDVESEDRDDPLVVMIFAQLQKLWSTVDEAKAIVTSEELRKSYVAHHAFSWANDPYAAGGYALFGPGQFEFLYTKLTPPLLNNRFIVCGEAISAHHAWISGALDSAYKAVWAWLEGCNDREGQKKLEDSPVGGGKGENPAELEEETVRMKVMMQQLEERFQS